MSNTDRARVHRQNPTEPEKRLWQKLRNRQLGGIKFRRQTPLGPYIADFFSLEAVLIVEVDGDGHASRQAEDAERTAYLESEGFRVIRFSNTEVMANMDGVLQAILIAAQAPHPPKPAAWAPPSPAGRG